MVMVDKLTKDVHFIPMRSTHKETVSTKTYIVAMSPLSLSYLLAPKMNQSLWFHFAVDSMVICSFLHFVLISSSVKT
jgi:hypothetical protein